jgi:hypothetical protein
MAEVGAVVALLADLKVKSEQFAYPAGGALWRPRPEEGRGQ